MRLPILAVMIVSIASIASAPLHAESRPDTPVLKDAYAVLRIEDAKWLDRQATQLAASCGQDPAPTRERIARALFCSASFAGVDLQRASLLAWRPGKSGLVAVIPVSNRRAFVDNFGAMPPGEPPLVRVGDREGTVIYSQNRIGGKEEYRLLVSDNTAYLARSSDECRQLASHPLTSSGDDCAVGFTAWGPFATDLPMGVNLEFPAIERLRPSALARSVTDAIVEQARAGLLGQVSSWSWQLRSAGTGGTFSATLKAVPDSPLAEWMRAQANQGSRVAAALTTADTAFVVSGQLAWQGQCDALGQQLATTLKPAHAAAWTPAIDESWRSCWSMLDRTGAFAWGVDLRGDGSSVSSLVIEQPQAESFTDHAAALQSALGDRTAQSEPALPGFVLRGTETPPRTLALASADRYVIEVESADADASAAAAAVAGRLGGASAPSGPTGVLVATLDLTRIVRDVFKDRLEPDGTLPMVAISAVVKVGHDQIHLDASLPVTDASQLLNKVGWNLK